jgi:KDO2-lipid IV(A) lauroyltransferase
VDHEERLWQALETTPGAAPRGAVAALPHMANWDLAGAWGTSVGIRVTAVAERLEPEEVFERFVTYREALGMEIIALTGGGDPFPQLIRSIEAGRLVCLVADRDLTSNGVDVVLAGSRTRMPPGPAALALRTGTPLVPVTLTYEGPRMRIHVHEAIAPPEGLTGRAAVAEMTQRLADVFGPELQAHPHDWHMLQRFWLDGPASATARREGDEDLAASG